MALHTSGEIPVGVPRDVAFGFLQDPPRLAACIPGCSDLGELGPNRYSAVLNSRVGFLTVRFTVTIDVTRVEPAHSIEATITGDAVGLAGHVVARAGVALTDAGAQQTIVRYTTDITLTGRLGGIGQPVFRATSARLAREFGDNLKQALEAQPAPIPS